MESYETFRTVVIAVTIWMYSAYQVLFHGNFFYLINFLPIIPLTIIYKFGFQNDQHKGQHYGKKKENKKSTSSDDDFYKLNLLSKRIGENSDLLMSMSSSLLDAFEIIPATEKILEKNFIPDSPESDENSEIALIDLNDNNILKNSPHNNILTTNIFENQIHNETAKISEAFQEDISEAFQEDISEFENTYRQNQQDAFEEFVRPNFNIRRLPNNSYCAEWLLKHAQCCIGNWKLDNSDNSMDSL
ncbi:hypothetical protein HNY73_017775 [Argiope bruennichi]|uniref:Transmembrane protein n=1 Tax=Argiope bruennichi TaxID=94029 RepID=A0A8T0EFM7_ARGBR|nr:hypothetical protein HNY73_017775 [Argiope bruennichi]